jgi:hypothetical protein
MARKPDVQTDHEPPAPAAGGTYTHNPKTGAVTRLDPETGQPVPDEPVEETILPVEVPPAETKAAPSTPVEEKR